MFDDPSTAGFILFCNAALKLSVSPCWMGWPTLSGPLLRCSK